MSASGSLFPDINTGDFSELVAAIARMKTCDVINNRAIARSGSDFFYVEGCRKQVTLTQAVALLQKARKTASRGVAQS